MVVAKMCIGSVARRYQLSFEDILGKRRHRYLVKARHHAMWLVRRNTSLSYTKMAKLFNKDHATVIYGVRKHGRYHEG